MYHRYVEFKPFVAGMFTSHTIRGRLLNRALHHQHARIYNYDRTTKYGSFNEPSQDLTKLFLDFVHYDEGGRIFTYVLSLDGLFRFTETGKEFGIDLLSKHTMHSDVSIYIAFSGEFFVRRVKHAKLHKNDSAVDPENELHKPSTPRDEDREQRDEASKANAPDPKKAKGDASHQTNGPSKEKTNSTPDLDREKTHRSSFLGKKETNGTPSLNKEKNNGTPKDDDPTHYELIIDNDSGTYRPNADTLPLLHSFLAHNLPGLKIRTLDCQKDEELQKKLKNEQREKKKAAAGDKKVTYMQNSSMSSLSSSDEEELEQRGQDFRENRYKHGMHKFIGGGHDDFHGDEEAAEGVKASDGHAGAGQQNVQVA
jgi:hypothetical protein